MNATLIEQPVSKLRQRQPASISAANKAIRQGSLPHRARRGFLIEISKLLVPNAP